jgi:cullin-associated NEDD8-dissociated protein 1
MSTADDTAKVRQLQLALLVTGDLGRIVDLSSKAGVADRLKAIYVGYFESSSEDIRSAASYALGNSSVGSPSIFLPAIVGKLDEENKKQQYLLLSSLREYIQCSFCKSGHSQNIVNSLNVILVSLEKHCTDEEEGIRTMVAECLGSLACVQPEIVLKKLEDMQNSHSVIVVTDGVVDAADEMSKQNALVCWTVATSVKLAISGKVNPFQLASFMPTFVKLLCQNELHVRNAALLMVYSAVHHQQQVVVGLLKDPIIPTLYEVATLRMERKVDLGPFKHTVDDALPLRKAALSIFSTLETIPGCIDMSAFIPLLVNSLSDPSEDIQLQVHQTIISMCVRQSTFLVSSIESFVEPLEKNITKKAGSKTGTELERLNDWIKSAVRVMLALSKLEGAMSSQKFAEFVDRLKSNSKFAIMLASLEEEGG